MMPTVLDATQATHAHVSACGFLLLDKPRGKSSQQALSPLKRPLRQKRIGHAGTLDPLATGLLVAAAGKATRLLSHVEGARKEYLVCLRAGVRTDTLDLDGQILSEAAASWDGIDWEDLSRPFLGEIGQVPPAFSAISVGGVRSYERARKGEDVVLPARRVTIDSIEPVDGPSPLSGTGWEPGDATLRIRCSKGTYVRSLVRDLGERAGFGASVSALRRTAIGPWRLPDARTAEPGEPEVLPVDRMFDWPRFHVREEDLRRLSNGNDILADIAPGPLVLALGRDGVALAFGRVEDDGRFRPEALLVDQILESAAS
ncbi:MAG TPA: tRNA pseudouridine(55) synthase TruB [Fibrobacteria bacterium]|nr:tRNA pseudouridine(55) synthase TruB [Fibrobacteria bacterium]